MLKKVTLKNGNVNYTKNRISWHLLFCPCTYLPKCQCGRQFDGSRTKVGQWVVSMTMFMFRFLAQYGKSKINGQLISGPSNVFSRYRFPWTHSSTSSRDVKVFSGKHVAIVVTSEPASFTLQFIYIIDLHAFLCIL